MLMDPYAIGVEAFMQLRSSGEAYLGAPQFGLVRRAVSDYLMRYEACAFCSWSWWLINGRESAHHLYYSYVNLENWNAFQYGHS